MKFDKRYIAKKQEDYEKLISTTISVLSSNLYLTKSYDILTSDLVRLVKSLPDLDLHLINTNPEYIFDSFGSQLFANNNQFMTLRYLTLLDSIWIKFFELGIRHSLDDIFYQLPGMKQIFDDNIIISSNFGLSNYEVAEFADEEEPVGPKLTKAQMRNIQESKRKANELRERRGYVENILASTKGDVGALTIKEQVNFTNSVELISNSVRQAEASKKTFLSSEYMRVRKKILSDDYSAKTSSKIKDELKRYLNNNAGLVSQIRNSDAEANDLVRKISADLKTALPAELYASKARTIAMTELSLAYNFGKLSGFMTPEDMNKRMRWRNDFERSRNRICDYCSSMNNRTYTVAELVDIGTRLDGGIYAYDGKKGNITDFKNPSLPMIPAHPYCMCSWIPVLDDFDKKAAKPKSVLEIARENAPIIVGAGLVLTGAFLLSRSNVWRSFRQASVAGTARKATNFADAADDAYNAARNRGPKVEGQFKILLKKFITT